MFTRILVPLDGSKLAERAIPHAEQFARTFGSSIILLHILDPVSYHENHHPIDPLNWQISKTEADLYMSGIAARVRKDLFENTLNSQGKSSQSEDEIKNRVEYSIREGKTAENIVNFAHAENIDLLVISTHGAGGLSRWNISSITHKVISLIYLPVLLVRAYNQPEAEEAILHYRRILLPIDSSRRAECSLSAGIALARGSISSDSNSEANALSLQPNASATALPPTKLLLAAVIKPPEIPIPEPYPLEIEQLSKQLMLVSRQAVGSYLNEIKERLSVECETCMIENNSVSSAIQELASQQEDIDLVLLCAHGYTGQSFWPYGSVASNYIEYGTKPVLVIQDVPRSRFNPSTAEVAAGNTGGR